MNFGRSKFRCLVCGLAAIVGFLYCHESAADSVLIDAPADSSLYDKSWDSLNVAQRRKLSLYGLRFAPLDPRIWGLRSIDVTESKILIPIRPFFLRASESKDFRVASIEVEFEFKKVSAALMEKHPREHDPVLEVGFAGRYTRPESGRLPVEDTGFAARLSGFPQIASGLYEHSRGHYTLLQACSLPTLETGRVYRAVLEFSTTNVDFVLDGSVCATLSRPNLQSGLLSIETSWSPVLFKKLDIRALRSGSPAHPIPSGIIDTAKQNAGRHEN